MSDIQKQSEQFKKMTEKPVEKLVASLAVPTIITMLVTNIYNLVDTAFVGKLGTSASGAVGVVFGFMAIMQAIGFMCGQGAGSIMSRKLGAKDTEEATKFTSTGFFLSFSIGIVISIISEIFLEDIVYLLGSTKTIAPYAITYIQYILIAAPFVTSSFTLNNFLRYEGKARLGMIGMLTGAILNIGGDALFMFGLHMDIAGAGLSTMLSQIISFSILLFMFLSGKTQTKIGFKYISFQLLAIGNICATGFPSLLRQILGSLSTILLNTEANVYGDEAIAAMSIVSRISFFVLSIAIGIGQGFQPVASFNYGAQRYDRVKKAYWFTFQFSEVLLILLMIPVFIFAPDIVWIFRDDAAVIVIATRALRLHCISLILIPITMVTEMGFQSTGHRVMASIASSLRSGLAFIPTLFIFARWRGLNGIQEAQPMAYLISFVIFIAFAKNFINQLDQKQALFTGKQ